MESERAIQDAGSSPAIPDAGSSPAIPDAGSSPAIVIGAGPAGLATAACLLRAGVTPLVLEARQAVGSSWRAHYDRLHLHTVRRHSGLPGMPMPEAWPDYPSRAQVVEYLESYAARFGIEPRFGQEVKRIARLPAGDAAPGEAAERTPARWEVTTQDAALRAQSLVIATGYNRVPTRPAIEGLASFGGEVIHSSEYKNGAHLAGKEVLVVGCGNSGAEIAIDLHEHGARPSLVVRGPIHVMPRDLLGRPSQETGILLSRLPLGIADRLAAATLRLAVGDLSRWGIRRPDKGPIRLIVEDGRVSMLDVGTLALIKRGRVRVLPGVTSFRAGGATFADGRTYPFSAVVLATGYETGLSGLFERSDTLLGARGRPRAFGEAVLPGLYFVGFKNPPTGALREIAIEARRVAASIAARGVGS